jgi:selenocysteine lyase/cysteine desulfurase
VNLLYHLGRVVFRVEKREGRDVHRVPDDLRPLNTRVINLDVGALAPTLEVVDRGLRVWTRVVAGSAPTSKRVWQAITDERETLPSLWQRNLRGLTWRTVEGFRSTVGELVGVAPRSVVFLTSTTRALDAVLETVPSYDRIVTTNCEHSSEVLLFQSQGQRRGAEIRKVDLLRLLAQGAVFDSFVQQMAAACSGCQRPLVVVSEVPYCFGVRLPIAELAHALRAEVPSAMLVVDGAHTVGQCPVNLEQCDFDYYVFGGHKWLFGPPTLGILVLGRAPSRDQHLIESLRGECFESLAFEGSRLGEAGATIALEPFVGLAEFLGRLLASGSEIFQNIRAIRSVFEVRIQESRHVRVLKYDNVPADRIAPGIVNLQGKSGDLGLASLGTVRDSLEDKDRVVTKLIEGPPSVRVCLPFYLTIGEVERAVEALDEAFASVGS